MKNKIIRQIDEVGRIVIPIDLRKQYGISSGERLCFETCDDGILIRKDEQQCETCNKNENKTEKEIILSDNILCSVLSIEAKALGITTEEYVDRFLDDFYDNPKKFLKIIDK